MGSPSGLSPGSPNKYLGPNVYLGTVVQRNREPTGADYRQPETGKLYPYATLWVVGKDPTTGTQGDIWILGKIASNVADWLQIGSGGVGPLLTVTTDSGIAVPDGFGNMNFFGQNVAGSGIATSASGSTASYQMDSPYSLGNFTFNYSVSGSPTLLRVSNTSNTAGSDAALQAHVAGSSGGDAILQFLNTGASTWTVGLDNSDGDNLVIAFGAVLGTLNSIVFGTGGNISVPRGDLKVSRSNSGTINNIEVANDSNTAGSDAVLLASVAGTSSGDPYTRYNVSGAGIWSAGIDNSDSDAYVVSQSATPGTNNLIRGITTGGQYRGNSTNTAPPAGFIGEQISSYLIPGSAVSLADGVATNVTSISLTAGIWDVTGILAFDGTLTGTRSSATVTSTSATVGDAGDNRVDIPLVAQLGVDLMLTVPSVRFTLASTTTIYLVGLCDYTVGTCIAYGRISGTRVG